MSATVCIPDPAPFVWKHHKKTAANDEYYSGVMDFDLKDFVFDDYNLTTRAFGQQNEHGFSIPGPTITMVPGKKYVLSFHNKLAYEKPAGHAKHNQFKDPNIANIHTHGLHISGMSPGDDVTRSFEGGKGGDYVWDIPADHMGGSYWYVSRVCMRVCMLVCTPHGKY